jgi:hypothetical protein
MLGSLAAACIIAAGNALATGARVAKSLIEEKYILSVYVRMLLDVCHDLLLWTLLNTTYIYIYQHSRYAGHVMIPGLQSKTGLMKIGEPYLGIGPGCAACPWTLGRTSGRRSRRVTSRRTTGQSPVIMV